MNQFIKVPAEFSNYLMNLDEQGVREVEIHNRQQLELMFYGDHKESEEREKFLNQFEPIGNMKLVRL